MDTDTPARKLPYRCLRAGVYRCLSKGVKRPPYPGECLLPPQNPLDVIQLVQRLQRRQVVDVEVQDFVAYLAEDGVVQLEDPVLCQIRDEILNLDVNNLTPLEALNKLNDIKRIVRGR